MPVELRDKHLVTSNPPSRHLQRQQEGAETLGGGALVFAFTFQMVAHEVQYLATQVLKRAFTLLLVGDEQAEIPPDSLLQHILNGPASFLCHSLKHVLVNITDDVFGWHHAPARRSACCLFDVLLEGEDGLGVHGSVVLSRQRANSLPHAFRGPYHDLPKLFPAHFVTAMVGRSPLSSLPLLASSVTRLARVVTMCDTSHQT